MLYFYPLAPGDPSLSHVAERGLSSSSDRGVHLWSSLDGLPHRNGPVLVVDRRDVPGTQLDEDGPSVRVSEVPPRALRNVDPYRPPRQVDAGGGYVTCSVPDGLALLLIYRRGVWDLPKGTRDPHESIRACAQREVREEVGIDRLDVIQSLGSTRHGYADGDRYAVKTTRWYLMQTPERRFEPDRHEGIERVARARWPVARDHVGYDTLRRHMDRIEDDVRSTVARR